MSMTCCPYVYSPVDQIPFTVYFEPREGEKEQTRFANRTIEHLKTLDNDDLVEQSILFFKWIVLYDISECNLLYAEMVLDFFHEQGLLLCKREVNNPVKQQVERYLVIFSMKGHVFAKTYNSIRELRADTGKKPSQIRRMPTDQLLCKMLTSSG